MVDEVQVNSSATSAAYFDICEHCEQRITQQFAVTVELIRSFLSSGQYVVPYWSASPNANNSNNAWQLNFNNGNDNNNNRNNNNHVRLVRSGQWFSWERDRLGRRIKNEPVGFGLWANKPTSAPNPQLPH